MMRIELPEGAPRLDRSLAEAFPDVPRSRWETWIREGRVLVNGRPVAKCGARLRAGSVLETERPEIAPPGGHLEPEAIELTTLYEDDCLWIIDKPAGMVVHPGPGHPSGTIVNALLGRLRASTEAPLRPEDPAEDDDEVPAPLWPGLVHRLDRFTTGCLALAKDAQAQRALQAQFKARTVEKRYLALVRGSRRLPEVGSLLVEAPIGRHRLDRLKMTITASGREARTRVKVLGRACGLALVECELLTGRTHQIRVHLASLGAPLLGDTLYGGPGTWLDGDRKSIVCAHPVLHAWRLSLDHPRTGARLCLEAPLPGPFRDLLERVELGSALPR